MHPYHSACGEVNSFNTAPTQDGLLLFVAFRPRCLLSSFCLCYGYICLRISFVNYSSLNILFMFYTKKINKGT